MSESLISSPSSTLNEEYRPSDAAESFITYASLNDLGRGALTLTEARFAASLPREDHEAFLAAPSEMRFTLVTNALSRIGDSDGILRYNAESNIRGVFEHIERSDNDKHKQIYLPMLGDGYKIEDTFREYLYSFAAKDGVIFDFPNCATGYPTEKYELGTWRNTRFSIRYQVSPDDREQLNGVYYDVERLAARPRRSFLHLIT
jgi:hypothetical protein